MNLGEARSDEEPGGLHVPVLLDECIEALRPKSGGTYADLTLGGGGHARALLEASAPDGIMLALDRDPEILELTRKSLHPYGARIFVNQGNFSDAAELFADQVGKVDGLLMDLGLSSFQLNRPERGFSVFHDGPLDMRMDPGQSFTGRDLVNRGSWEDLLFAIGSLGEETRAKAVVRSIMETRKIRPLLHTSDLRRIVEKVYGRKGGRIHPATKTFQGLRMMVNAETESLVKGLHAALTLARDGGRLAVISFHSGEDRLVKQFFTDAVARNKARWVNRKPIQAGKEEVRRNRRSRSARLRVLEKT